MENARIIELMAKKLGRTATPGELEELDRLAGASPTHGYLREVVDALKGGQEHIEKEVPAQEVTETGWRHLAGRLKGLKGETGAMAADDPGEPLKTPVRPIRWTRIAAAVALLVAAAGITKVLQKDQSRIPQTSLRVANGDRKAIVLPDGTRIWLNAGSRLVYPDAFTGADREVTLDGEAFFDVASQPSKPFLVHAGKMTVKVLGTSFDVKAYKTDPDITTTLVSGRVQVTLDDNPDRSVTLAPHEKLVVPNVEMKLDQSKILANALRYQVRTASPDDKNNLAETAWLDDKLEFNDDTFDEVARELERKYDVQIDFANDGLKDTHVSGTFDRETLQQVFDILKMTTHFDYHIEGKKVTVFTTKTKV